MGAVAPMPYSPGHVPVFRTQAAEGAAVALAWTYDVVRTGKSVPGEASGTCEITGWNKIAEFGPMIAGL